MRASCHGAELAQPLDGLNTNGKLEFVDLSEVGNARRLKLRSTQPSTRGLLSDEPVTLAEETEPPGLMLKVIPTLPLSVGSCADAIS